MDPRALFIVILAISAYNGIASPFQFVVVAHAPLWMPIWLPMTLSTVIYGAAIITSSLTLLVAGIPAALLERRRGQRESDRASCLVWLGGVIVLTLPALLGPIG